MPVHRHQGASGFGLLELLAVLSVLALLLALSAPGLAGLREQHRLQAQAEDLLSVLQWARAQALQRQQRVTVCIAGTPGTCALTGSWRQGWLVFEDANANAQRDPQEALLQQHPAMPDAVQATGNALVARYVSYSEEGRGQLVSGAFQSGTITLCQNGLAQGWRLVINALGKPRLEKAVLAQCP